MTPKYGNGDGVGAQSLGWLRVEILDHLRIMRQQYRVELAIGLQYRVATVIWLMGGLIEPIVWLFVWSAVAQAQGGTVDGMTTQDFAAYFAVAYVVGEATYTYVTWEYEEYVRDGDFAAHLLKPIHPIFYEISGILADKTIRMSIVGTVFLLILALFQVRFDTTVWGALLFAPALVLATAIYFACDYLLALSAFWATKTTALGRGFDVIFILLSGYFAPLQLFPPAAQLITWLLPFRWVIAFPIELILGAPTLSQALVGIGAQLVWLALLIPAIVWQWRRGVSRFSAVGG